jgi:hypothetical protein
MKKIKRNAPEAFFAFLVVVVSFTIIGFAGGWATHKALQSTSECQVAAETLYAHVGGMFDQIAKEALIRGGYTGTYQIRSDGEVFPGVWYDFVTKCVPPPPEEGGEA